MTLSELQDPQNRMVGSGTPPPSFPSGVVAPPARRFALAIPRPASPRNCKLSASWRRKSGGVKAQILSSRFMSTVNQESPSTEDGSLTDLPWSRPTRSVLRVFGRNHRDVFQQQALLRRGPHGPAFCIPDFGGPHQAPKPRSQNRSERPPSYSPFSVEGGSRQHRKQSDRIPEHPRLWRARVHGGLQLTGENRVLCSP